MTQIIIESSNLTNSLVFYRTLFDKMPDEISPDHLQFNLSQFELKVVESQIFDQPGQILKWHVDDHVELLAISERISRFKSLASILGDCDKVEEAIGLVDPDGYHWIIGNPNVKVSFEKCYLKEYE